MLRKPSRLFTSLTMQPLVAGVEMRFLVLNVGVGAVMVAVFMAFWWIPLIWVGHQALKAMGRADPFMRSVYIRYRAQADRYEPWPEGQPRRGLRPGGAGRMTL